MNMFDVCTPEKAGVSSADVLKLIKTFDSYGFSTHSIIIARGNNIFLECYYAPFTKDFKHRMYSVSKSFVSVAVGLCADEGLLSLDDPFMKYFPEYENECTKENEYLHMQTIRDMLRMETVATSVNWFTSGTKDRCEVYFKKEGARVPGTTFEYDSSGSFMLCAIVEKVTGKPFLEYMKEKFLLKIGFSEDCYCLGCPGGHSWGDSGVMCRPRDLLAFARFVANGGTWDGVRYISEEYMRDAVKRQVDNDPLGYEAYNHYGYGYQIWKTPGDGFAFVGMGDQFAIFDPRTDIIFIINSDNQGSTASRAILYDRLFRFFFPSVSDAPLPENPEAQKELSDYISSRKLVALSGNTDSALRASVDGKTYILDKNPMNIKWLRFDFDGDKATLTYENAQGEKVLPFGLCRNEFSLFPEEGYSDLVGTQGEAGHKYECAASGAWTEPEKLRLKVQIIDKYFGNIGMTFGFRGERIGVHMTKNAEAFLSEYEGFAAGKRIK